MPEIPPNPVFDRLWAAGVPQILEGTHRRDAPPVDGGRWPVTVVARPPRVVRSLLEGWMREARAFTGPGHFLTGRSDSVHLTVRALEPYREAAVAADPIVPRWRAALVRAAAATAPLELSVTGITLSSAGVLAAVEPADERPWDLMDRVGRELGAQAWFEDRWGKRDIWYATLLHFARDVEDPQGLVDWASRRRHIGPVDFALDSIELVRFRHRTLSHHADGRAEHYMRPETWATMPLDVGSSSAPESEGTSPTTRQPAVPADLTRTVDRK